MSGESASTLEGPREDLRDAAERLDWQPVLFAPVPERRALLGLRAAWPLVEKRLRVHRNHTVEPALGLARPYLEFAGIAPRVTIGNYDDSLSFSEIDDSPVDAEIVWLDHGRLVMGGEELAEWLVGRLKVLRARSDAPILVFDSDAQPGDRAPFAARLSSAAVELGGVRLADRTELWDALGQRYFDLERVAATGSRMSRDGALHTARLLGARWLPALLAPRLKAVAVDLDNTLYGGVLGEDGPAGLQVGDAHRELGRRLRALRDSGVFLALASRNEAADVERLFEERDDLPLTPADLSAQAIGWQPKSESLVEIAADLRISTDAMLFVDDNPGELLEAMQRLPGLRCLLADPTGAGTVGALDLYPNLFSFGEAREDSVRVADLRANEERARTLRDGGQDIADYHRELQVTLSLAFDRRADLERVASMSNKTNQFNLAFARYTEGSLASCFDLSDWGVATAALSDRLSDSGIIAMAVTERAGRTLRVHELCVSCRALGRRLEDLIVARLLGGPDRLDEFDEVVFSLLDGPRNGPARSWLTAFAAADIPAAPERLTIAVAAQRVRELSVNDAVEIREDR